MTPNPYKFHNKQQLVKLYLKYNKLHKRMEDRLETLAGDDYLNYMTYIAHLENEFITPVKQMLNTTKRKWNMS